MAIRRGTLLSHAFLTVLTATALVVASQGAATAPAAAAGTPKIVLDPDDNIAFGFHDGTEYGELPITYDIAQSVKAQLPDVCDSDVVITRDASQDTVPRAARAAQMQDADVSVTLSLNSRDGSEWGTEADGGSGAFATTEADNLAFGNDLAIGMHGFTGRPFEFVNEEETNGTVYPYPEFAAVPGTYAQFFMLFIDHAYDWEVIKTGRDLMVDAVVTAIAQSLQAKGFKCLGTFPARPSAARLQQLRNLGYQRYLRYAADPVSMSTGNFTTSEETFALPGVGNQQIDLTLTYNAQSGIDSPVGVGWQFAYGAFLQQYSDGSVAVNLPDGRVLLYPSDGSGGFTTSPGAFATLTQLDATTFKWATTTGTSLTFTQDATGRGTLTATSDRQGNTETLTYGGSGSLFPHLTGITDQAGQQVIVTTNGEGRITSFKRPDGALWQLGYSSAGDLTSISSARGTVRHFGYDSEHRMTSQVGQDGVTFLTNTYDSQSRVVEQTNAFGHIRKLVFDDANQTTTYTDTTGAVTVYHWNALGQVTKVEDALGGTTTTVYSPDFLPTSETDPLSHTTTTAYDGTGQAASTTDPLGNTVSATHNAAGDLTSTTDSGGPGGSARTTNFTVNSAGLPTTITNPDGTTQTRTYNGFGDVLTSADENGAVVSYGYDSRGNTTTVTDPLGRVTTMTYDLANRLTSVTDPLGRTTSYQHDPNDNLTKITHPNGASELRTYDVNDQLASSTDRRGAVTEYVYDAELNVTAIKLPNGGTIKHTFDRENRLTSTTDAEGHKTTYTLDALGRRTATKDARGNITTTTLDASGQIVAETDPSGATTEFARDANGRVITVTDPAGGLVTTEWDQVGRQTKVIDQNGHATTLTYNFRDQVTSIMDPAGKVSTNEYDAAGRLIKQTDAAGAVTTFEYDAAGQIIKKTDPLGGVETYGYDLAGNRVSVTDANGRTSTVAYNSMNEPVARTNALGHSWAMVRDAGGLVTDEADPLGNHTTYAFDAIGNRTSTTDALGRTSAFGYDLNQRQVSVTAPDGVVTANEFDPVGNLTAVIRNSRGGEPASNTVNVTTRYKYDSRNLLTSTIDANGAVTGQGFNSRGLLTSVTNALGQVTTYGYDAAGNRISRTDANGKTTDYAFDARDLLVRRTYDDGSQETFTHDAVGRQLTAQNSTGSVTTAYDLLGRATEVTDAAGKTLEFAYDAVGNRTGLTLPDGRTLAYSFDAADQLTKLASPLGVVNLTYDAAGRRTGVQRPNGTITAAAYDNANELTRLLTTAGSTTLASLVYTYDAASNVASRAQNLGGASSTTAYTYDPLRRLTASTGGPLPSTYTYDAVSNRLTWSAVDDPTTPKPNDPFTQTNTFNVAGQLTKSTKVRQNGGATFADVTTNTFDANGNRILTSTEAQAPGQSAATGYAYDFENRLIRSAPTGERSARGNGNDQRVNVRTYDALGRLVTDTRGTTATTWTSDGLSPIVASDVDTTLYLRDIAGELLGERIDADDPAWYVTDALDSILGSTNSKAKLTNVRTYSDYGVNLGTSNFRVGFGGELSDPIKPGNGIGNDTPALLHYYARSYDPVAGVWQHVDPMAARVGRPETLGKYQFVIGNPSTNTDQFGYWSLSVSNTPTYSGTLSVTNAPTYSGALSVSNASSSWTGSLQGYGGSTQLLQPGATNAASLLQPTISGYQLQPAAGWDALSGACRRKTYMSCALTVTGARPSTSTSSGGTYGCQVPLGDGGWLNSSMSCDELAFSKIPGLSGEQVFCLVRQTNPDCHGGSARPTNDAFYATWTLASLGLGALFSTGAKGATLSFGERLSINGAEYTLSQHAVEQAASRSITRQIIEAVLNRGAVGTYEQGAKLAFYDPASRVFISVNSSTGKVITVIDDVTEQYVRNVLLRP